MKAEEIKKEFVESKKESSVGIIAIQEGSTWYHVHDDEELPKEGWIIAIHPRRR